MYQKNSKSLQELEERYQLLQNRFFHTLSAYVITVVVLLHCILPGTHTT